MKREVRDLWYSLVTKNNYFQYLKGSHNSRVVITAPHGGGIKPRNIPKRTSGTLTMDTYTRRLTTKLHSLFDSNRKPFCMISDIHRNRVDFNRSFLEGCGMNDLSAVIWKNWHSSLSTLLYDLGKSKGRILYIDLHSHNNNESFQLGYNLSASHYLSLYKKHTTTAPTTLDSISNLKYEMIFGQSSFHSILSTFGYSVYFPKINEPYFNGGYNIEKHSGFGVGGIQVECPVSILREELDVVAIALKFAIEKFVGEFLPD